MTPGEISTHELGPSELEGAATTLARAFGDNPLNRAIQPGSFARRVRLNRHGMRALLSSFGSIQLLGLVVEPQTEDGRPAGVLVAVRPWGYPLPPAPLLVQLRCLLGQGFRIMRRWGEVFERLLEVHPAEPHWYLAVLGVDPDSQGRGLGGAVLDVFLRQVDSEPEPVYLETDRASNVDFYRNRGFGLVAEETIYGVTVYRMLRPAHSLAAAESPSTSADASDALDGT